MALDEGIAGVAGSAAAVGTVAHSPALGMGPAGSGTGVDASLVLARQAGGTVVVGAALGSAGGRHPEVVGQAAAHRLAMLLPALGVGAAGRGTTGVAVYIH